MTDAQFATVSSIYTMGGLIGALSAGPISSKRGRLLPMRISAPFHILGSFMEALSLNIPTIAFGRFLSGLGSGASLVVGPIYISEIAPSGARGVLGAGTQIMTNTGILVSQVLGYFFSHGSMWRTILGTAGAIGILQLTLLMFMSESPEWLGANGKLESAWRTMKKIRGGSVNPAEASKWAPHEHDGYGIILSYSWSAAANMNSEEHQGLLTPPLSPVIESSATRSSSTIGFFAVLNHSDNWRAVVAVIGIMLAQQLTGINSVFLYSVEFLSDVIPTGATLITVTVGALNLIVTILCSPLSDKLGRKPLLLASISGMGINAVVLGCAIMFDIRILAAISTLLFVASFAVGLGPVPFILAGELASPEAVASVQTWALAVNWIATFLVAQFFPILNRSLGEGRVFFVFAFSAVIFFGFTLWWIPESKGKKDADEVWGRDRRRQD